MLVKLISSSVQTLNIILCTKCTFVLIYHCYVSRLLLLQINFLTGTTIISLLFHSCTDSILYV